MDYIDKAFIWAHEADAGANLILNDFNNEGKNDISGRNVHLFKGCPCRGVTIDGIGMQMHIDGTHPPDKEEVVTNMKRFDDLGLKNLRD